MIGVELPFEKGLTWKKCELGLKATHHREKGRACGAEEMVHYGKGRKRGRPGLESYLKAGEPAERTLGWRSTTS